MATHRRELAIPGAEFAASLLAHQEVSSRAQVTANQVTELIPGISVVIYVVADQ